jgi:methylglutaconyl-CoA hydratase
MEPRNLSVRLADSVAYVTLGRPAVRNAFNAELIGELHHTFEALGSDGSVRAIVLAGEGKTFCGGADVQWMRASLDLSRDDNLEDARRMSRMFRALDRCPKPVIARVQGAALGGGAGLVASCDVAIAASDALFGFTETKLGILPAVISPFVLAKIGTTHARALALTGERFGAERAQAIGLIHEIVPAEADLDAAVARVLGEVATASPTGIAATKALFAEVIASDYDATLDLTAQAIAAQRTSTEGQDGLRAFLEKRRPAWAPAL